ncbi:MAG: hypothetical protein IPG53_02770 [Ignavibacteriales bacterium]|nr:hypothetical protein [Ignavibacteriales bacterium]
MIGFSKPFESFNGVAKTGIVGFSIIVVNFQEFDQSPPSCLILSSYSPEIFGQVTHSIDNSEVSTKLVSFTNRVPNNESVDT